MVLNYFLERLELLCFLDLAALKLLDCLLNMSYLLLQPFDLKILRGAHLLLIKLNVCDEREIPFLKVVQEVF
jgi:hypothetical protein